MNFPFLCFEGPASRPRQTRGFSLVELALAVGITSFCLLTLLALLPTGLHSADTASRQGTAVNIGAGILADLKSTASYAADNSLTTLPATTRYAISLPTSAGAIQYALYLDNGGNVTPAAQAQYLAILTLISQNTAGTTPGLPKPAVLAQLFITWPAQANPSMSAGQHAYTPGSPGSDLRAQVKNFSGLVELAGTVDLEQ
ncbi:MAG: hypothetical protein WDO13_00655 [Verrucomicrobiota bacterium]